VADSFWLVEPGPLLASQPLAGPADVEIVGGGITGCSCALSLARAGGGITGISAALTRPHRVRDVSFYGVAPAGRRPG
jgi:2-polyprenyl-6-methoxyphenol hydroxylase-like FAD-dependent oxidoreductase